MRKKSEIKGKKERKVEKEGRIRREEEEEERGEQKVFVNV